METQPKIFLQISHVSDDIIESIDHNKITALVLLYFNKAFDTLNHSLLLEILSSCGFLESYVRHRTQAV